MSLFAYSSRRGQTLVEALVALSILTVGFVGIATLLTKSFQLNRMTMYDTQGTYLAAEGIELTKNLIDHDVYEYLSGDPRYSWGSCFPHASGYYYPIDYQTVDCSPSSLKYQASQPSSNRTTLYFNPTTHLFSFDSSGAAATNFTRTIYVANNGNEIDVQSTVAWTDSGISNSITLEDHFYNWQPSQSSSPSPSPSPNSFIPGNAIAASGLDDSPNWLWNYDPGTPGSAVGTTALVSGVSLDGQARQFVATSTGGGGEIYHLAFANDAGATHFFYDAQVYLAASNSLQNLELDTNQVMSNGDTVIYGIQCDGGTGTWDYTENSGSSPTSYVDTWVHSSAPCNPASWTTNAWHHVQFLYSRDNTGNVTYSYIWLDGVTSTINATVNSDFSLGWTPGALLTNFQLDGKSPSASMTAYADEMTISRW